MRTGDAGPGERSWLLRSTGAVLLCVLVVLTFYLRAGWSYGKSLSPQANPVPVAANFENQVANALLAGQLSLKVEPPSGLLQLRDPYDPNANGLYRGQGLHDYSLYKGTLYSYFGPAPAVLLYIPFRALRVGALSPTLATLVFSALGFLFSLALFRLLARWAFGNIPVWMHCVAVFTLGLGVPVAWLIYIGRDYEATIACGYMLVFLGLYLLARGIVVGSNPVFLALGSGALGLAVGARPDTIIAGVFVLVAAVLVVRAGMEAGRRNTMLVAVLAPYVLIGVLIAAYNYLRFDSITEFGLSYQLAGFNPRKYQFGSVTFLLKGAYYYLLSPGRIMGDYPFLFLRKSTLDVPKLLRNEGFHNEPVAGLFTNMPAAAVGYLLLVTGVKRVTRLFPKVLPTLGVLVAPAIVILMAISYQFRGTTMRYEIDFAPLIVLGALFAWVAWNRSSQGQQWQRWIGNALFLSALAATIAFSTAITLTPCAGTGSC